MSTSAKGYEADVSEIDDARRRQMEEASWRPGCPVRIEDLRVIRLTHKDFEGEIREGELIVHERAAGDIVRVFRRLFAAGFPIERIEPVDVFEGDDERSMAANNTSAFNGREIALRPGEWSQHAYGLAIDLNTVQNPFVRRDGTVMPAAGARFLDRSLDEQGMIKPGDVVVRAFADIGWRWGGEWQPHRDFQHFSANGT